MNYPWEAEDAEIGTWLGGVFGSVREPVVDEARTWGALFPHGTPSADGYILGDQVETTRWVE